MAEASYGEFGLAYGGIMERHEASDFEKALHTCMPKRR
jgi:hypothetical protein